MLALRVGSNGKTKKLPPEGGLSVARSFAAIEMAAHRGPLWRRHANAAAAANSPGSLAIEQLQRRFVHPRIAGGDDAATALRGIAFLGRHDDAVACDGQVSGGY